MLDEEGDEINNENGVLDDALDEENQVIDENDSNIDNRFPEVSEVALEYESTAQRNEVEDFSKDNFTVLVDNEEDD